MSADSSTRLVMGLSQGSRDEVGLIGGKGASLAEMARLGLPIPPGFVVTTEACAAVVEAGELPDGLGHQIWEAMGALEEQLGRGFGDDAAPLLVSVRSGAPVSMPGMMETILNVGLTRATLDGFARSIGDRAVADDCLARLTAMFGNAVGNELPDDPRAQLEQAIAAVFASWNSRRARLYRRYNRIPDSGTAVVVQAMVFGNASADSGTGVVFTRDPSTGEQRLFGDYLARAQGEDIVAGSHNAGDIAEMRALVPDAYDRLEVAAAAIERHFADLCEIEFTVEDGRLWLLQARPGQRARRAEVRVAVQLAEEGVIERATALERVSPAALQTLLEPQLDRERLDPAAVLTTAIGAAPGVATGVVALDTEAAVERARAGERVILVRTETRPEDLEGIIACAGLLTTRGGKTSHAAVVARGLGRPCVCGAEEIVVDGERRALRIGARVVREGEELSIDGTGGYVLADPPPLAAPSPPAEVDTLLRWADAVGGPHGEGRPAAGGHAVGAAAATDAAAGAAAAARLAAAQAVLREA